MEQAKFFQTYPELHSLLTAYLAVADEQTAIAEFIDENTQQTLQKTQAQLTEVLSNSELEKLVKKLTNKNLDLQEILDLLNKSL